MTTGRRPHYRDHKPDRRTRRAARSAKYAAALGLFALASIACSPPRVAIDEHGMSVTTISTDAAGTECLTDTYYEWDGSTGPTDAVMCIPAAVEGVQP